MNERTNEQSRTNGIDSAEEQHSPQREATAEQNTPPAAPQTISDDLSGEGRLLVRVTTATGAIPLENATVVIRDSPEAGGGIVASLRTDRSGLTPVITLAAPPKAIAQQPGTVRPFSTYNIDVILPGYFTPVYEGVPVFDGITSVQSVGMIPLPENGFPDSRRPDEKIIYPESNNPEL